MIPYPVFNPVAFEIGPVQVHWYGIMYLLGFLAAWWLARLRAARAGSTWKANDVDDLIFYCMLGVILGGRIGYVLFYGLPFWATDIWYPLKIWEGGMSFHGGMLGVIVAMTLFARRQHRNLADVYDFTVPLPPLGLFFGRIGNFINGELWGKPTTLPWGFVVNPLKLYPSQADAAHSYCRRFHISPCILHVHASQLYEATLEGLVLFAVMWWFTSRPRPRLAPSGLFLAFYGTVRCLIELVRVPDAQIGYLAGGWLTEGQVLSAPMILIGIGLMLYAYRARSASGNFATAQ